MNVTLMLLLCCQSPVVPDPIVGIKARLHREIDATSRTLEQFVRDDKREELKAELTRLDRKYVAAGDDEGRLVAMSAFLRVIATEDGSAHASEFREICRPYAQWITDRLLPTPAHSELHEAQLSAFIVILGETVFPETTKEQERTARVRTLVTIWHRVVMSWAVSSREFSQEVLTGEVLPEEPPLPKSLYTIPFVSGQSPDDIRDPRIRQEYKDYLNQRRELARKLHEASEMSAVRKRYLKQIRAYLERLYGPDRKTWDELRKIVDETVDDKELAQQVLKDLTRKKNP